MMTPKVKLQNLPSASAWNFDHDVWYIRLATSEIVPAVEQMLKQEARLMGISGMANGDETLLAYHFAFQDEICSLKVMTSQQHIPSITPLTPAADWAECEAHDLYDVVFDGHPALRRLVRPAQLETGFFRQPGGNACSINRYSEER
jgi:NADH:ubiquinone oxidoreductase subunit C